VTSKAQARWEGILKGRQAKRKEQREGEEEEQSKEEGAINSISKQ
jgi:hypothetical protein